MENYCKEATAKTPKINFDYTIGELEITGRSIPENSFEYYAPVLHSLDEYIEHPRPKTVLKIMLEYFNTSSSKCLVELLRKLEILYKNGYATSIKWFYEEDDEDMLDSVENFKEYINIPIEMLINRHNNGAS